MFKLSHNYTHLTHAKQCSKFSKGGFNIMGTENFQRFKLDLEKAEEPELKLPIMIYANWITEKTGEFQKNIYFCVIDYAKVFVWITSCEKFLKRWEYQTTWPASWEICMQVKNQQLKINMEPQLVPN